MTISAKNLNLDKNPNLKPEKKPWNEPIGNWEKTNNISNDPNTLKVGDFLIWKGNELSQDYLRTITEDQRDEIAKDVYNFWKDYPLDQMNFSDKEIKTAWKSLCNYKTEIEVVDGITYISNSGTSGSAVYRHFFPNIIKVAGENRPSIYQVLTDPEKLWHVIRNRMGNTLLYNDDPNGIAVQYPMNQSLSQLGIGAKNSGLASMGSIFKPSVAKTIYSKYSGKKVLDYSCGFGTRLLGLMSLQNGAMYCGYEPNTETYNNLQNMIKYFGFNAHIKQCGSETEVFDEKFDFIFSSPPYFNVEVYSDEETQCYNRYPEYNSWLENYWRGTVKNIVKMSNKDTVFAINVGGKANEMMQRLEKDMNNVIKQEGYALIDTWCMKTSKSHLSSKKGQEDKKHKLEGIFFYKLV